MIHVHGIDKEVYEMSNKKHRNKPIETNEELDIYHSLDDIETADTEMTEN